MRSFPDGEKEMYWLISLISTKLKAPRSIAAAYIICTIEFKLTPKAHNYNSYNSFSSNPLVSVQFQADFGGKFWDAKKVQTQRKLISHGNNYFIFSRRTLKSMRLMPRKKGKEKIFLGTLISSLGKIEASLLYKINVAFLLHY